MRNKIIKIVALCLCVALLISMGVYAVVAGNSNKKASPEQNITGQTAEGQLEAAAAESGVVKDETVYVIANADGTVQKIIVSDWVKEMLAQEQDNAAGVSDEDANHHNDARLQDTEGENVYYQGTIQKQLPVDLAVSYKLNGIPISANELAGKSGRVTIRFDYRNNQYESVIIGDKDQTIYVPFAVLTGVLLDNDTFTNIEVSNGKILNDGNRTAVIGLAFPGLQESLAINKDKLEIPSYVEITADATDFSLGMTVTVATNSLFNQLDTDKKDFVSDLTDAADELDDAMTKLLDGSSELYDGLSTLLSKSEELVDGVDDLEEGAEELENGAYSLNEGAKKISSAATTISNGLETLSANSAQLSNAAEQVFDSLLANAESQLTAAGVTLPTSLTISNYDTVLDRVIYALGSTPEVARVQSLKDALDDYNTFYEGVLQYTAGVDQAAGGAAALKTGAADLQKGADNLFDGMSTLHKGILKMQKKLPDLVDGVTKLKDGSMELSDGLSRFNKEGIQKLLGSFGDAEDIFDRLQALKTVSQNYKLFGETDAQPEGNVKFVYRTSEIK